MKHIVITLISLFILQVAFADSPNNHNNILIVDNSQDDYNLCPYDRVVTVNDSEIYTITVGKYTSYYYVLYNHNLHSYDTIHADTKKQLLNKISDVTRPDNSAFVGLLFIIMALAIVGLIILMD